MAPLHQTLRATRILHVALLVMVLIVLQASYSLKPLHNRIQPLIVYAVVFVCANDIGLAAFFRRLTLGPAEGLLRSNPNDQSALRRWRTGVIISLLMAWTIVVFGLFLRVMGAGWNIAGWFFLLGVLLLLVWRPGMEISTTD